MHYREIFPSICCCLLAFATITVLTPPEAAARLFEWSYALVVGIDRYEASYEWKTIKHGKKDALAVAKLMESQGYEVTLLLGKDATRENILSALSDEIAPKLTGRDRVMMFFSGHGETREVGLRDFGYIIPYNGTEHFPTWISMAEMREMSAQLQKARHQLFIFDSCYGGSIGLKAGNIREIQSFPRYIEAISSNRARQFITAGGKNELVRAQGPHGHSFFTGYLLQALNGKADLNSDTYITQSELSAFLVHAASNWDHTPRWGLLPGHEQGEYWFRVPRSEDERKIASPDFPRTGFFLSKFLKGNQKNEQQEPLLLSHPQGPIDDFTRIPGINIEIQAELYEIEVFHYWQIADWNLGNIEWMKEKTFKIRKNVKKEWINDATEFANQRINSNTDIDTF